MLTKNSYLEFLRCPREFWLNFHSPANTEEEPTPHQQHLMDQGFEVLQLAKKMSMFKGRAVGLVEFHRIFSTDYLTTSSDITVTDPKTGELYIYEVKSATKVKPEYLDDVAFQQLAAEMLGNRVAKTFIITVDTAYTRNGEIEPDLLLKLHDVTEETTAKQPETLANVQAALRYITEKPEPELKLHCSQQLDCGFIRYHFKDIPVYNVTHISRLKHEKCAELIDLGILDIRHVPADFEVTEKQRKQIDAACRSEPLIEREAIRAELASLRYPLNFLDYESFNHAVPKFHGTRPFQQMVFQYSLHTIAEPGAQIEHRFHLSRNDGLFPPREIAESLNARLNGKLSATIVWNAAFEKTRNREIGEMFPDLSEFFDELNASLFDLETIFARGLYHHPGFMGSTSIKNILPVLCPETSYHGLNIADGSTASVRWYQMAARRAGETECQQIYDDLCAYCRLDTLAMVRIFETLSAL